MVPEQQVAARVEGNKPSAANVGSSVLPEGEGIDVVVPRVHDERGSGDLPEPGDGFSPRRE